MSACLTEFQKKLCNALQRPLPVCSKPFADLAQLLDSDERTVLEKIGQLRKAGILRRLSAVINYAAIGLTGTLVAAHVPRQCLRDVTEAVNSLENVSHNYLREHHYNLWFTLLAHSPEQIEGTLSRLSERFGIDFHSLPAERVFKLDVRFDAESGGQKLLQDVEAGPGSHKDHKPRCEEIAKSQTIELNEDQKRILSGLQNELDLTAKPFDFLCGQGVEETDVLRIIAGLIDKGVIRRIAGVVDHRKLGFVANVLFCCEVAADRIVGAGERLARTVIVSHCYRRKTFENWPYNLFAMMHGRSMGQIQHAVHEFIQAEKIGSYELLTTQAELKKQPVKHWSY